MGRKGEQEAVVASGSYPRKVLAKQKKPRAKPAQSKAEGKRKVGGEEAVKGKGKGKSVEGAQSQELTPRELLALFNKCEAKPTRYPDVPTMKKLGIYEDCQSIFKKMGLARFMDAAFPSRKEITNQFLSSLEVVNYEDTEEEDEDGRISFKLGKTKHTASFSQIAEGLDLKRFEDKDHQFEIRNTDIDSLWEVIGIGEFSPAISKSTHIRHPAIRYAHKALAHTLYARKECGTVTAREMDLLYMGVYQRVEFGRKNLCLGKPERYPCLVTLLMDQMLQYKTWVVTKARKEKHPQIHCGGIVSAIILACGVDIGESLTDKEAVQWMDLPYLKKTWFLGKKVRGKHLYRLTTPDMKLAFFPLPNEQYTSTRMRSNIDFYPSQDMLYHERTDSPSEEEENDAEEEEHDAENEEGDAEEERGEIQEESYDEELEDALGDYTTEEFHFTPHEVPSQGSSLKFAHDHINKLQNWCKKQDKTIKKLVTLWKNKVRGKPKQRGATSTTYAQAEEEQEEAHDPNQRWRHQEGFSYHDMMMTWGTWETPGASSYENRAQGWGTWENARASSYEKGAQAWGSYEAPRSSSYEQGRSKRKASKSPQQATSSGQGDTEEISHSSHT